MTVFSNILVGKDEGLREAAPTNRRGWVTIVRGYCIAVGSVAAMALFRSVALRDYGGRIPFVTILPAVIVAALYGGLGPGILATVLGALYTAYFVLLPSVQPNGLGTSEQTSLVAFTVVSLVMVLICAAKTRLEAQARDNADAALVKERSLVALEHRHREVLDGIADAFCTCDRAWRYTYMNRRAEALYEVQFVDVAGKMIWEAFPGLLGTLFEENCRLAERERQSREFEYWSPRIKRWLEVRIYPSEDGYALYSSDVTDRRLSAEAVIEKEKQLRLVTNAAPALIGYIDSEERYVFVNRAYEEWFDRPAEQFTGRTMEEILGSTYEKAGNYAKRALAGESVIFECPATHADGTDRSVQASYAPDKDGQGNVIGFVSVITDVTALKAADASLRASERVAAKRLAELDNLYRLAPAGLCVIDRELRFVRVNEAIARITGRPLEDHIGRSVREVLGDLAETVEPILLQAIKTGRTVRNQAMSVPDADSGEVRNYLASYEPLFDPRRELLGLSVVVQDVTSLRDSQRALALSEERYRTVVESAAEGIWTADRDGVITFANEAMASMLGYDRASLIGRNGLDFIIEEDVDRALTQRKSLRPEAPSEIDLRFRRSDGSIMWARVRAQATFDEQGKRTRAMALVTDITEQKRFEDRQKMLVEASHVLSGSLDYESTLKELARFMVPVVADWCSIHIRRGDAVTQLAIAHSDPDRVRWAREMQKKYPSDVHSASGVGRVLATGRSELYTEIPAQMLEEGAVDEEHRRIIDELGLTSAMIVPLTARGRTIGAITLVTTESKHRYNEVDLAFAEQLANRAALAVDNARLFTAAQEEISERIEAEREVRRLNSDLEQRVDERTRELRLALSDLEGFCYTVSHDLRAPMRSISGNSMIILEEYGEGLDEGGKEILGRLAAAAAKMGALIDDLLQFSRLGRAELSRKPIDLSSMARAILEEMHATDPERACVDIQPGLETEADPMMARLVLQNLLENALKYSSKTVAARIEVGQGAHSGQPAFFVRDNGIGFDMLYVEKIFQPFERLHRDSEFPGTGIGLANVRRIVMRHGGHVWAESEPGHGSTFYFTLGCDQEAETGVASEAPSFLA